MTGRSTRVLFLVGLLVGVVAVPAMAATFSPAPGAAVQVSDGVTFQAPSNATVTLTGNTNMTAEDMFDSDTVRLNTSAGGNMTVSAPARANATVDVSAIEGTWTNVTDIDAATTWLTLNPADKQRVAVTDGVAAMRFRAMTLDDGTADFIINGTGTGTVEIAGLPADTTVLAVDADTGTELTRNTTTAGGVLTLSIGLSEHTVTLQTEGDGGDGGTDTLTGSPGNDTHLWLQTTLFAGALWWTKYWLLRRPAARWRFATTALSGTLLWVVVAYTATNAQAADGAGGIVVFNSLPLAYFGAFMAVVSLVGAILGLLLWTEEEAKETGEGVPETLQSDVRE